MTQGDIEVGDDRDWFQFTAVAGAQYVFETMLGSVSDTKLALYASNGTTLLELNDDIGPANRASRIEWTAPTSGTHYLEATAASISLTGTYTLDVSSTASRTLGVELSFADGVTTWTFVVGADEPSTWSTSVILLGNDIPLWSIALPPLPPITISFSFPIPPIGVIEVQSTLAVEGGQCSASDAVDTGSG